MLGVLITEAEPCGCTVENPKGVFPSLCNQRFFRFSCFFLKKLIFIEI